MIKRFWELPDLHYHIYNPNAISNKDLYLDNNGNSVRKGHTKSHIRPEGKK